MAEIFTKGLPQGKFQDYIVRIWYIDKCLLQQSVPTNRCLSMQPNLHLTRKSPQIIHGYTTHPDISEVLESVWGGCTH